MCQKVVLTRIITVKKHIKNETGNELGKLDIPSGLQELLTSHRFTIEQLLNMRSSDVAVTLGIHQDAARLIIHSVRQRWNHRLFCYPV